MYNLLQHFSRYKLLQHYKWVERCFKLFWHEILLIGFQILVVYWKFCTSFIIWNVDITENRLLWWMYTLIHCFAWVQFFVQFVFMDPLELFGVKQVLKIAAIKLSFTTFFFSFQKCFIFQVYYSLKGWNDPLIYKSNNLRRLYHYMRHQGLIVLSAVLLVYPIMR